MLPHFYIYYFILDGFTCYHNYWMIHLKLAAKDFPVEAFASKSHSQKWLLGQPRRG